MLSAHFVPDFQFISLSADQLKEEGVEGSGLKQPDIVGVDARKNRDTVSHLRRSLAGEGQEQDLPWVDSSYREQIARPADKNGGLA